MRMKNSNNMLTVKFLNINHSLCSVFRVGLAMFLRYLGEQSSRHGTDGSIDRYWSVGKINIEVTEVMVLSTPYLDTLLNCTPCYDV